MIFSLPMRVDRTLVPLPKEVVDHYLTILGVVRREPCLEALRELLAAHLTRIPFENISKLYYRKHLGLVDLPTSFIWMESINTILVVPYVHSVQHDRRVNQRVWTRSTEKDLWKRLKLDSEEITSAKFIQSGVSFSAVLTRSAANLGKSIVVGAVNGESILRLFRIIRSSNSEYKLVQFGI